MCAAGQLELAASELRGLDGCMSQTPSLARWLRAAETRLVVRQAVDVAEAVLQLECLHVHKL